MDTADAEPGSEGGQSQQATPDDAADLGRRPLADRGGLEQTDPDDPDEAPVWIRSRAATLGSQAASMPSPDYDDLDIGQGDSDRRAARRSGSGAVHPRSGQTLRAVLTLGLALAVVLVVFLGILLRLPPADYVQYVSPLTALAGLALGYWFGSDKHGDH